MKTTLVTAVVLLLPTVLLAQAARYPLQSAAGLRPLNVVAEPATLQGKKGIKVLASQESAAPGTNVETLLVIDDLVFGDGVIEAEIAGDVRAGAPEGARGFVGIAFRVQNDLRTYDAFYLRPTNGRAEDQVRRNHSAQYVAHPDWPWFRRMNPMWTSFLERGPESGSKCMVKKRNCTCMT